MNLKYIVTHISFCVFNATETHAKIARGMDDTPLGAGFVIFRPTKDEDGRDIVSAHCYGESISLGIKSRGEEDQKLIENRINEYYP